MTCGEFLAIFYVGGVAVVGSTAYVWNEYGALTGVLLGLAWFVFLFVGLYDTIKQN